jgi:ankyrin repeat protein
MRTGLNKTFGPMKTGKLRRFLRLGLELSLVAVTSVLAAETPERLEYERDIEPVLRDNCVECHGPSKQKGGMRLDQRSSALKAFSRRVVPGSSANSMVYLRLTGNEFGNQMPPTKELEPGKVAILKAWIDQGAKWPDALANDQEPPPPNPKAVALVDTLRTGDIAAFLKAVETEPMLLNERGPEGSTPFMYAVLYTDTATLGRLLKLGADPNKRNDVAATALMWAARDLKKTRLLVQHGADVNARSDDRRTSLMIAARRPGATPIVKYLLDHGANPNPNSRPIAESSPLMEALTSGDEKTVELLIRRGADAKAVGEWGLNMAVTLGMDKGLELLAAQITDTNVYSMALGMTTVFGDLKAVRLMLDHGADVNGVDPTGRTPLMYAAISDLMPVDVIELLIQRGANVNAVNKHTKAGDAGLTVLDIARLNGDTPVVQVLQKHGAKEGSTTSETLKPRRENNLRKAVQDSVPLLQRTDALFAKNSGCTSCHNNSMEAMAVGLAKQRGIHVDDTCASDQVQVNLQVLQAKRDWMHQGYSFVAVGENFSDFVLGYQLVGLHAQHCPPDLNTDAAAMLIQSRQKSNGEWPYPRSDTRPPICLNYITQTTLAMRALQLYAPQVERAKFEKSVRLAAAWLAKAKAINNDDRAWRLTGLAWAGLDKVATQKAMQEVLASQRSDGGWSDIPSLPSGPYATGLSLVALHNAGLAVSDPAYQRGVQYLLKTQQEDGSWYARTRALAFQPYFDAGFPHTYDQWISAAATSWATMALALALPDGGAITASR